MKRLTILFIIMIFLMISAVSAEDNATMDNLTMENPVDEDLTLNDTVEDVNVTFKEQMWEKNLTDIDVELPENASGDFCIKIDDEVIYNETITEKAFKVPIKLPKRDYELYISIFPPVDCKIYRVTAFYNDIAVTIPHYLKVMRIPPDFNYFHFPKELLYGEEYPIRLFLPRSSNGILEVYLDDKLLNRTQARPTIYMKAPKWSLGNHTLKVIYCNDTYYNNYTNTFEFEVTRAVIDIPETINVGHDDCISVETKRGTEGTVEVYLNSKLVNTGKLEYGGYILSLEKYLKTDTSNVTVKLKTKDFTRTKTQYVNVTYDFDIFQISLVYGQDNIIEVMLPDTLNNKLLHVKVDGKDQQFKKGYLANNVIEIDVTKFAPGNHTLFISYDGDARFKAQNKTCNFTIDYKIYAPFRATYQMQSKAWLKLPADAKGNLVVELNGKPYKSTKFNKGYAEILINDRAPGKYDINVYYDGDDYNVTEYKSYLYASAKTTIDHIFTKGEDAYIIIEAPKESNANVTITIDGKPIKINLKNGFAKYSLKNLKIGEHEIEIHYHGTGGYEDFLDYAYVTVSKPKIKYLASEASFDGVNLKIKVLTKKGKILKNKKVTVKFNGKTYKLKTNKKGLVTLKKSMKLKKNRYSVKIYYMGAKITTKTLKLKQLSLKTKTSKNKVIIKAKINKKLKNKVVKFKVNKKTIRAKTNSKGIAKITVKKTKTIKVKATYQKSSVSETIECS